jgi:hypothetical protein
MVFILLLTQSKRIRPESSLVRKNPDFRCLPGSEVPLGIVNKILVAVKTVVG